MKNPSRRAFIGAGLALPATWQGFSQTPVDPFRGEYHFVLQEDVLARTSTDGALIAANPWAVSEEDADLIPYVTGEIPIPLGGGERAPCPSCDASDAGIPEYLPVPKRFLEFRLMGELPTATEILRDIVEARRQDKYIDLSLLIQDATTAPPTPDVAPRSRPAPAGPASRRISPKIISPQLFQYWVAFGYRLQVRGPDYRGMVPCAPEAPRHYHVELFRQNGASGWDYLINLHIAIWRVSAWQYCFALANNEGWPACIKICNPTWNDFYQSILGALLAIGITYFAAVTLASVVASLLYGSVAVLAV